MYVYRQNEIKNIDHNAAAQGFSLFTLMENAGRGLFEKIYPLLSKEKRIIILAGKGNNGGDGIVLARYLKHAGYHVDLTFPVGMPKTAIAKKHLSYYYEQGFDHKHFTIERHDYDVIIDCLLGIGTTLPLRPEMSVVIKWMNDSQALKMAVDVPTGVVADHGECGEAFQADVTFCLHGAKPSAFLLPASHFYGRLHVIDIGLKQTSHIHILSRKEVKASLPRRGAATHKGTYGTSLLVAGNDEMPGSALLSAIGAIRVGTGKLMIATTKFAASIIATQVPEATYLLSGLEQIGNGDIPKKLAAVGIGPGIDAKEKAQKALIELMKHDMPLVVDAGALLPLEGWHHKREAPVILTPHPGEFSRLTQLAIKDIQANRIEVAQQLATSKQVTIVLKGQYTVIAFPDGEAIINPTGNSGLAKGGSGDVLTGIMVSMLATHKNWKEAIANAVYIHGLCADQWTEQYSEASMVASDFNKLLPIVLKQIMQENDSYHDKLLKKKKF